MKPCRNLGEGTLDRGDRTIAGMEQAEEKKSTLDFDPDKKSDLKQREQEMFLRPRPGLGL